MEQNKSTENVIETQNTLESIQKQLELELESLTDVVCTKCGYN